MVQKHLKVQLGCIEDRLAEFINIDYRPTPVTVVVMDLNIPKFKPCSISFAFSNAFFEHLYRDKRLPHLQRIYQSMETDGVCCYIGIPYFKNIARYYLQKA